MKSLEELDGIDGLFVKGLHGRIGDADPKYVKQVEEEIENLSESKDRVHVKNINSVNKTESSDKKTKDIPIKTTQKNLSTEKIIENLYEIYDNLIDSFSISGLENDISDKLLESIKLTEKAIRYMGVEIESFDPFNYISGLDSPDLVKNAESVINNTTRYYKIGEVIDPGISEDGSAIRITFRGNFKGKKYSVTGYVKAKYWTGNEAIDYVCSSGKGKMSVKAFENGKWNIKDVDSGYQIEWEIDDEIDDEIDEEKIKEKNNLIKKDIVENSKNELIENNKKEFEEDLEKENIEGTKEEEKIKRNNIEKEIKNSEDEDIQDFNIIEDS